MRAHILAEPYRESCWFTTADVARALQVTSRSVRRLADAEQLTCERTVSGLRIFRHVEVLRLVEQRAKARLRGVRQLRPKKRGPREGPRQLSFFSPQLRIVGGRGRDE